MVVVNMKKTKYLIVFIICMIIASNSIYAWSNYSVGDLVEYNGVDYYVITNSGDKEENITLLKREALTTEEVNTYGGVGTENNHVNMYTTDNVDYRSKATDNNGIGEMAYYSSPTCRGAGLPGAPVYEGCVTNYETSEIKYVVDAWTDEKTTASDLRIDSLGYKARLLTMDDLIDNLGYSWQQTSAGFPTINENVPTWLYSPDYAYWTMSQAFENTWNVWSVENYGRIDSKIVILCNGAVRPVITITKSALGDTNEENIVEDALIDSSIQIDVPNTLQKTSIVFIMVGVILISFGIILALKNSDNFKNKK